MCEKPNNAYCLRDKINAIDREIELERIVHNKRKNALHDERDKLVAELYKEGFIVVVGVPSMQTPEPGPLPSDPTAFQGMPKHSPPKTR